MEWSIKSAWNHWGLSCVLGLTLLSTDIYFIRRSPAPGVAIAVLGAVAAIMSIREPNSFEKVTWTLMAFGLLYAEVRAIHVDRQEQNRHALEDKVAEDLSFLSLNKKQDSQSLATAKLSTGLDSFSESVERQFSKKIPVQSFGMHDMPASPSSHRASATIETIPATSASHGSSASPETVATILPPQGWGFAVSQTDDVSTRKDAPYKIRVVIATPDTYPSLRLALKCNAFIVEAQGLIEGSLRMTNQGITNADRSVWIIQYQSASIPFGPTNPIFINVWAASPIVCAQARTF